MSSVWIAKRQTQSGQRFRVMFRVGGADTAPRYGGSFKTKREAQARKGWVSGELAAMRLPDLRTLSGDTPKVLTLTEAAAKWRDSRIDVSEGTRVVHRVALDRVLPTLGTRRVDELTVDDVNALVTALDAKGRKRATIKKSVKYLAAVLDDAGVKPNPARGERVRFPYEEHIELEPPTSEHVESVVRLLPSAYRLALLWLDWSGARLRSIETVLVGDYDEPGRRIRLRAATTKTRAPLWVELPDVLAEAITATLPPREDRDSDARLFPGVGADKLRTAIGRACKAAGVPVFSPHDLRHRRISLLHRQNRSWAEIARFVGHRKLSVTADTYTHVLSDGREVDYADALS